MSSCECKYDEVNMEMKITKLGYIYIFIYIHLTMLREHQ